MARDVAAALLDDDDYDKTDDVFTALSLFFSLLHEDRHVVAAGGT